MSIQITYEGPDAKREIVLACPHIDDLPATLQLAETRINAELTRLLADQPVQPQPAKKVKQ